MNKVLPEFLKSTYAEPLGISPVEDIIADIRNGRMVVLVDEEDRENEGDLVVAAEFVTPEIINFMATHGRGLICLTLSRERCQTLGLEPMVSNNGTKHGTNFTVSIEAAQGVTTGISAADRAHTIRTAVAAETVATDLVSPGHVFPLIAQDGGVLVRAGHTEAGCDLARLAGLEPAAVICEILSEDGSMARLPSLLEMARQFGLRVGTIADLIAYRSERETLVERAAERMIDTPYGEFRLVAFYDRLADQTHLALVKGTPQAAHETLVRVHEPLSVMDFLDYHNGEHAWSLQGAMQEIHEAGCGVLVLLRREESASELIHRVGHEGERPHFKMELRDYGIGAQILRELGVGRMRLLSRPRKMPSMTGFGLEVTGFLQGQRMRIMD